MLKNLLVVYIVFNICIPADAQHTGFYGNVFAGPVYNSGNGLQQYLKVNDNNNIDLSLNKISLAYGVSLNYVSNAHIIIGSSGYMYQFSSGNTGSEASLRTTAIFMNTGYSYFNNNSLMMFPYIGIGEHFTNYKITNFSNDKVFTLKDDTIPSGKQSTYYCKGLACDFGFSFKYFNLNSLLHGKSNSIFIGIDAGTSFFFDRSWKNISSEDEISFANDPIMATPYIKCSLGLKF